MNEMTAYEGQLRAWLKGNAMFSVLSGLLLVLAAPWFAQHLGGIDPLWVRMVGGLVVLFGLDVYWSSRRWLNALTGFIVSAADASWVLGTLVLLAIYWPQIPATGRLLAIAIGAIVALFGIMQLRASLCLRQGATRPPLPSA